jgi:hypothetical protein
MVDPEDAVTRPLPHPTKLRFVWHSRFYTAVLDRDLFDQWTVTRSWGSTKSGQGAAGCQSWRALKQAWRCLERSGADVSAMDTKLIIST